MEEIPERGERVYYAADESFLLANRPIPPREYYDDFHQLENGVGMVRLFLDDVEAELERLKGGGRAGFAAGHRHPGLSYPQLHSPANKGVYRG